MKRTDSHIIAVLRLLSLFAAGTPQYVAPELITGQHPPSSASDVYSFAMVMYQMFTRKIPFYESVLHALQLMSAVSDSRKNTRMLQ